MRSTIISLLCCLASFSLTAQGIIFRNDSWEQIKATAKAENKLVFIDVYTSWCGPCKLMVKDVFSQKEIGDFFNANFVCFGIDAEKGEGLEIAATYKVNSFPTYLFVDGNGKLYYRSVGSMPVDKFLGEGKLALSEFADEESLEEMTAAYPTKKDNPAFLRKYIEKRDKAELDNADLLDEYVRIEQEEKLLDPGFLLSLQGFNRRINAGGSCEAFLLKHWDEVCKATGRTDALLAQILTYNLIDYSYQRAVKERNSQLLETVLASGEALYPKLGLDVSGEKVKLRSRYFADTDQKAKFEETIDVHAHVLFEEEQICRQRDKASYRQFLESMIAKPSDLATVTVDRLEMMLDFAKVQGSSDLSFSLRDLAKAIVRLSDKNELLFTALTCAMESVFLFDNFSNYETLADVLWKLGRRQDALRQMRHAREIMPRESEEINVRIDEKLEKYKNN